MAKRKTSTNDNPNEVSCLSQKARIEQHLNAGNFITSLGALNRFGCMRLASRVSDLNSHGKVVDKVRVVTNTDKRVDAYYKRDAVQKRYKVNDELFNEFVKDLAQVLVKKGDA